MTMLQKRADSAESHGRSIQDLREWLERVEALGELVKVTEAVDWNEEMSAISYLVAKQSHSPAVLFERPSGYENSPLQAKLLWNILGPSIRRIALTMEEPPDTPALELIRRVKDKLKQRIPPREIPASEAPVYEHSWTGEQVAHESTSVLFRRWRHAVLEVEDGGVERARSELA